MGAGFYMKRGSGRRRAGALNRAVPVPGRVLGWRPMARPAPRAVPPEARQAPCRAVPVPGQIHGPWAVLTGRRPDGNIYCVTSIVFGHGLLRCFQHKSITVL